MTMTATVGNGIANANANDNQQTQQLKDERIRMKNGMSEEWEETEMN